MTEPEADAFMASSLVFFVVVGLFVWFIWILAAVETIRRYLKVMGKQNEEALGLLRRIASNTKEKTEAPNAEFSGYDGS